jgi:hypothetical protein
VNALAAQDAAQRRLANFYRGTAYSDEAGHGFRSKPDSDTTQAGQ